MRYPKDKSKYGKDKLIYPYHIFARAKNSCSMARAIKTPLATFGNIWYDTHVWQGTRLDSASLAVQVVHVLLLNKTCPQDFFLKFDRR